MEKLIKEIGILILDASITSCLLPNDVLTGENAQSYVSTLTLPKKRHPAYSCPAIAGHDLHQRLGKIKGKKLTIASS